MSFLQDSGYFDCKEEADSKTMKCYKTNNDGFFRTEKQCNISCNKPSEKIMTDAFKLVEEIDKNEFNGCDVNMEIKDNNNESISFKMSVKKIKNLQNGQTRIDIISKQVYFRVYYNKNHNFQKTILYDFYFSKKDFLELKYSSEAGPENHITLVKLLSFAFAKYAQSTNVKIEVEDTSAYKINNYSINFWPWLYLARGESYYTARGFDSAITTETKQKRNIPIRDLLNTEDVQFLQNLYEIELSNVQDLTKQIFIQKEKYNTRVSDILGIILEYIEQMVPGFSDEFTYEKSLDNKNVFLDVTKGFVDLEWTLVTT